METYNEVGTAQEAAQGFTPLSELLGNSNSIPGTNPDEQVHEAAAFETVEPEMPVAETVESETQMAETVELESAVTETQVAETVKSETQVVEPTMPAVETIDDQQGNNDCLADKAEIVKQIHEYHGMAEKSDTDALGYNWEAGTRFNALRKSVGHGNWESFLKEHLPDISLSTIWRYRRIADSFTLKELTGMTLSQAYTKLKLAKFQAETFAEGDDGDDDPSSGKKKQSKLEKFISTVAKAAKKFDAPTSLSQGEKTAVLKVCTKLEDVYGQVTKPSLLGLEWQAKIEKNPSDWEDEDVTIFTEDFAKLQKVQKDLELLEGEPGDNPQEEAASLPDAPPPIVPESESVS